DLPGAEETARQLEMMLHYSDDDRQRMVMRTSAATGSGVAELVAAMLDRSENLGSRGAAGTGRTQRMLAGHAAAWIDRFVRDRQGPEIARICAAVQGGDASIAAAIEEILRMAARGLAE
ncbi:MAG: hypothetical protein KGL54_14060, partial [Sphingomonadales bacterium]|nr:hypothetical protein [Sphingomonadales bacterium]